MSSAGFSINNLVGTKLGDYHIESLLGAGGFATVFKARHPRLKVDVAIKVLHPQIAEDEAFLKRFHREAQVVAKLRHQNILTVDTELESLLIKLGTSSASIDICRDCTMLTISNTCNATHYGAPRIIRFLTACFK